MVSLSVFVALRVTLFCTVSALELTTAKWDAKTSGKTVFAKLDWDKLTEQRNSGDRAATFVVTRVFQVGCTRDTVKPLCDLSGVRGFPTLKLEILVLWKIPKEAGILLLRKFATENLECLKLRVAFFVDRSEGGAAGPRFSPEVLKFV